MPTGKVKFFDAERGFGADATYFEQLAEGGALVAFGKTEQQMRVFAHNQLGVKLHRAADGGQVVKGLHGNIDFIADALAIDQQLWRILFKQGHAVGTSVVAARSGHSTATGWRLSAGPAGHRDLEKMFMAVPTPSPTAPRSERTARTLFAEVHSSRYMCQTRAPSAVPATTSARRLLRGTL